MHECVRFNLLFIWFNRKDRVKKKQSYSTFKQAGLYFKKQSKSEKENIAMDEIETFSSFKFSDSKTELDIAQIYENTEFMSE